MKTSDQPKMIAAAGCFTVANVLKYLVIVVRYSLYGQFRGKANNLF